MPHSGYNTSYDKAVAALQCTEDPLSLAGRCGATYDDGTFLLDYFGSPCSITLPACDFQPAELKLGEKILLLHYIASSGPIEENPPKTTFESLPGGMFYFPTFRKRGPDRVINDYGDDPQLLLTSATTAGWPLGSTGDVSVIIPVFPLIDVEVVLYAGDDEFPPEVSFLFRKDINSFLPLEDVAVLGGVIATRLLLLKIAG